MVTKVNEMVLRVLGLFTEGYDKEYYIREVQKMLGISSRTAMLALAGLEESGILVSRPRGKIKTYRINDSVLARELFVLAEQYRRIQFFGDHPLIREILEKADGHIPRIAVVFGSYAKGTHRDGSDLDLFMVGKHDEGAIKEIGKTYGVEVSTKGYPLRIFRSRINEDILLREIVGNHVVVKGTEAFVGAVRRWTR